MRSVGIDLGKRKSSVTFVECGEVKRRMTVSRVRMLKPQLGPGHPPARVVIEAARGSWSAYDLLTSWGNQVIMVDTTRAKQLGIGHHGKKTDRIDADVLALALDENRIPAAHVLSMQAREIREQLLVRRELVTQRRRILTQIRGLLEGRGVIARACGAPDFLALISNSAFEPATNDLITPLATLLAPVEVQLATVEEKLHRFADAQPAAARLATVPGVAIVTAMAFISVLDDPRRFRSASQVSAYLGLVPCERSSGGRRRLGAITKQGNCYLRSLLVQSAWAIMRSPSKIDPLVLWARRVCDRRGKSVAVVAVARRLTRVMWSLWKNDDVYDPVRLSRQGARGHDARARDEQRYAAALRAGAKKLDAQRKMSARRGNAARELIQREGATMA